MAIGSEAEIGALFGSFEKDEFGWLTRASMVEFYTPWREMVGDDLLGGWATLIMRDK